MKIFILSIIILILSSCSWLIEWQPTQNDVKNIERYNDYSKEINQVNESEKIRQEEFDKINY